MNMHGQDANIRELNINLGVAVGYGKKLLLAYRPKRSISRLQIQNGGLSSMNIAYTNSNFPDDLLFYILGDYEDERGKRYSINEYFVYNIKRNAGGAPLDQEIKAINKVFGK